MYNAVVLADSCSLNGFRVTTLEVTFPRFILAEFNTHRRLCASDDIPEFSRNSASSRAIPVERRIEQISKQPFIPEAFGANTRGMQAAEQLEDDGQREANARWCLAIDDAVRHAAELAKIGAHKQHANRVIETYAWHTVVVTATEWGNWDGLRVSAMAQPEMFKTAGMMKEVRQASKPITVNYGDWHLPYVRGIGDDEAPFAAEFNMRVAGIDPVKVSVGRCAAVSYERQSSKSDMEKDAARCDSLRVNWHMSPFEHALRPMSPAELEMFAQPEHVWDGERFKPTGRIRHFLGNVEGWVQYRKLIPGEDVYTGA